MRPSIPVVPSLRMALVLLVWSAAAFSAYYLYNGMAAAPSAVAIAQANEHISASRQLGRIVTVDVAEGQRVVPGQILAHLETGEIRQEISVASAQLLQASSSISATDSALHTAMLQVERNFESESEASAIELKTAQAAHERERAEMVKLQDDIRREQDLVRKGLTRSDRLQALDARRPALEEALRSWPQRIDALTARQKAAAERLAEWRRKQAPAAQLEPLHAKVREKRESIRLLQSQLAQTTLSAGVHGYVTFVHARAGAVVKPGDPVVTIVEANPRQIVAYVDEKRGAAIPLGSQVKARHRVSAQQYDAVVTALAGDVSELPRRLWTNPAMPAWGRAVYITLPDHAQLSPGELFDVTLAAPVERGVFVSRR